MDSITPAARARIEHILAEGRDMVLATVRADGYPQATCVSYVHRGLTLFAGVGLGSQKAANIALCPKVSVAITLPYPDWNQIRGLSLAASAEFIHDADAIGEVGELFLYRYPQLRALLPAARGGLQQSVLFLRIQPSVISLLDYRLGFGHTEQFQC